MESESFRYSPRGFRAPKGRRPGPAECRTWAIQVISVPKSGRPARRHRSATVEQSSIPIEGGLTRSAEASIRSEGGSGGLPEFGCGRVRPGGLYGTWHSVTLR
jgi:hypothetical protein